METSQWVISSRQFSNMDTQKKTNLANQGNTVLPAVIPLKPSWQLHQPQAQGKKLKERLPTIPENRSYHDLVQFMEKLWTRK